MAKLISAADAAKLRCRTPQALAMERARNEGPPYIRDGGRILYDVDELDRWIQRHRVDPALVPAPQKHRSKAKVTFEVIPPRD